MSRGAGGEAASIPIIELVDAAEDTGFLESRIRRSGFLSVRLILTEKGGKMYR